MDLPHDPMPPEPQHPLELPRFETRPSGFKLPSLRVVVYTHLAAIAISVLMSRGLFVEMERAGGLRAALTGFLIAFSFAALLACPFLGFLLAFRWPFRVQAFAWVAFVETLLTVTQMYVMGPMVQ